MAKGSGLVVRAEQGCSGGDAREGQLLHSHHHQLLFERFHLAYTHRRVGGGEREGVAERRGLNTTTQVQVVRLSVLLQHSVVLDQHFHLRYMPRAGDGGWVGGGGLQKVVRFHQKQRVHKSGAFKHHNSTFSWCETRRQRVLTEARNGSKIKIQLFFSKRLGSANM